MIYLVCFSYLLCVTAFYFYARRVDQEIDDLSREAMLRASSLNARFRRIEETLHELQKPKKARPRFTPLVRKPSKRIIGKLKKQLKDLS